MSTETVIEQTTIEPQIEFTLEDAIKQIIKESRATGQLAKGLNECVRALETGKAKLCIMASDVDNDKYRTVVSWLCQEKRVKIVEAPSREELGKWLGFFKLNEEGEEAKIVKTSCIIIKSFNEGSAAAEALMNRQF